MSDLLKWSQSTVAVSGGGADIIATLEEKKGGAKARTLWLSRSTGCRRLNVVVRCTQSHEQTEKEKYSAESQSRKKK